MTKPQVAWRNHCGISDKQAPKIRKVPILKRKARSILSNILANPARLSLMGAQARVRAERDFNLDHFIESTMAVYQA